jgi:SAM-dependent methyltransferase
MAYGESVHALRLLERLGLKHVLDGDVLDMGCGPEAVLPRATGVNRHGVFPVKDLDCDPLSTDLAEHFKTRQFDTVFSSHALEHMYSPVGVTLDFWLRFVKPGGYMVLYLPDEKYYQFHANPMIRNPEHLHYLTMDTFEWRAGQLNGATLEHLIPDVDTRHGRYSFLAIVRKT